MMIKYNFLFIFRELRNWAIGYFHVMSYFFIQFNGKLNVGMQNVTIIIV